MITNIERKARLVGQVCYLANKLGLIEPWQINNLVAIAVEYFNNGESAATAYDLTRKHAENILCG